MQSPQVLDVAAQKVDTHPLDQWELRIDKFRVFYDIEMEHETVLVKAVGVKVGNKLFIRDEEFAL